MSNSMEDRSRAAISREMDQPDGSANAGRASSTQLGLLLVLVVLNLTIFWVLWTAINGA